MRALQYTKELTLFLVFLGYALSRVAEWRLHRQNYWVLLRFGAEERSRWLSRLYYLLNVLVIPLALAERIWRGPSFDTFVPEQIGLILVFSGFAFRFWSLHLMSDTWSMACLKLQPDTWPVARFFPRAIYFEHLARFVEAIGLCLVINAVFTIFPFICFTYWVSLRLAKAEIQLNYQAGKSR